MSFIPVKCSECGKVVQLEGGLKSGFCSYCGASIAIPEEKGADIAELIEKAEAGDVDAQYAVASMYRYGKGVPQDNEEAVRWYKMAAENGDPYAYYNLGVMCASGLGMKRNCIESERYFEEARKHGYGQPRQRSGIGNP
jgi:hypothetical protein